MHELTLLPGHEPGAPRGGHRGRHHWLERRRGVGAATLGVGDPTGATQLDAVLAANGAAPPTVLPGAHRERRLADAGAARVLRRLRDHELARRRLHGPAGHRRASRSSSRSAAATVRTASGASRSGPPTASNPPQEARIIGAWLAHMTATVAATGHTLADARIVHWSPAEPVQSRDRLQLGSHAPS